jgi:hypothetical protein
MSYATPTRPPPPTKKRKKTNTERIQYSIHLIESKEKEEIDARFVDKSK